MGSDILHPDKPLDMINILVDKKCTRYYNKKFDITDDIMSQMSNYIDKNENNKKIIVEQIINDKYILDIYNKYKKAHIFFVTHPIDNEYMLYELSMANVLIVSPLKYVSEKSIKLLDIITYSDIISWDVIFDKLATKSNKHEYTPENVPPEGINQIIKTLQNFNKIYNVSSDKQNKQQKKQYNKQYNKNKKIIMLQSKLRSNKAQKQIKDLRAVRSTA